jgi:hypothetical protein
MYRNAFRGISREAEALLKEFRGGARLERIAESSGSASVARGRLRGGGGGGGKGRGWDEGGTRVEVGYSLNLRITLRRWDLSERD